jgi:hypothetical protein
VVHVLYSLPACTVNAPQPGGAVGEWRPACLVGLCALCRVRRRTANPALCSDDPDELRRCVEAAYFDYTPLLRERELGSSTPPPALSLGGHI